MDLDTWSLYASAVLLLCLTPGPNSLLAVTNGLRFGVGKTLFSTFGCAVGLALLIGASLSGLGLILAASETVFYIIKWLGACYLIYLGISLIRTRGAFADVRRESRPATPPSDDLPVRAGPVDRRHESEGGDLLCRLPAAVLRSPQHGLLPQFLVMAGTFVGIEVVVEILLAAFASRLAALRDERQGHAHVQPRDRRRVRAGGGVPADAGASSLMAFP